MSAYHPQTGANRIAGHGRLSPSKTVSFTFDGKRYNALEGDTLASALLANGIHLAGRSFKYHRPRGILTAGPEEPNALMDIERDKSRRQPNVRATCQEVFDGMKAKSQNAFPSLSFDVGAVNDGLGRFFSAGFYYKTFMWPKSAWEKLYEPVIRKAAGLGESPNEPDPDRYANRFAHCETLIIGGGAAGLMAALTAARAGAKKGERVILVDENPVMGGALLAEPGISIDDQSGAQWAASAVRELAAMDDVTLLNRTTAFGYYSQNMLALVERIAEHQAAPAADTPRERLWQVRAGKVILATGAIERHLVFAENDRPGIMLAGAAQRYLNEFGVTPGRKIGVYTSCDSAYSAAFDLKKAGVEIVAIVDCRKDIDADLMAGCEEHGIQVLKNQSVISTTGRLRVRSMITRENGGTVKDTHEIDCLLVSGGWTPSVHLFSQSRGKLRFDAETQLYLPDEYMENAVSVGACNGTFDMSELMVEAVVAGNGKKSDMPSVTGHSSMAGSLMGAGDGAGPDDFVKAFVDYQNDVTAKDIRLAVKEGFRSIEHVKRYTTNGMATDQGKLSNMHGLAIAAEMLDKPIPEVGLTTFRSPYTPVTFGAIVNHAKGELFDVTRRTPIDGWSREHGAVFEDVGNWKRAWYYPASGEDMDAAVNRECKAVRDSVGMFDASTLGKIEVVGPDAVKFMNMMYTNPWDKLAVGRLRYGIMCREDGFIYDDGVVARMAEDRFHVTTTTGGAPRVLNMMEDYLQTEFPEWNVWLTSTSEQWAVIAVQGPKAREVLKPLVEGIDMGNEVFPHMSVREGRICGVPTRLMRMSFTGETGFEVNVPADHGRAVWEAIYAAGQKHNITPYGTEAMHVLRAEKGYIIVGQDTDGTVTPHDAGLGWAIGKKKTDFVGIRGLSRPDLVAEGRRQLVGLRTIDSKKVLEEGAQIVDDPNHPVPVPMIGFVTSSYWSENLGRSIALALVENGSKRMGQTVHIPMEDETIAAEIVSTVFYDPDGGKLNG